MPGNTRAALHSARIRRIVDATAEEVWKAWTEPERFAQWFYTAPFETPAETVAMDVRPGGEWRATQVNASSGDELPFLGTYREVDRPRRLVFTFEDPRDRANPDVEVATLTLHELDGMTEMTLVQEGHLPEQQYPLLQEGYGRFFDNLEAYISREGRSL